MPKYPIVSIILCLATLPAFSAASPESQPSRDFLLYLAAYSNANGQVFDPNDLHQLLTNVPPPGIRPTSPSQEHDTPSPVQTKEPRT